MESSIAVSGIGIICAIGGNPNEVFDSLKSEKSGIVFHEIILKGKKQSLPLGVITTSNQEFEKTLNLKPNTIHSRTALLGLYAARQALSSCNIKNRHQLKGGLISATSVGGMDVTEDLFVELDKGDFSRSNKLESHDSGYATQCIANDLLIDDYVSTISTACSSSANSIMLGAKLLQSGKIDYALVGGTDAITRFTIQGFGSLMIFDDKPCQPFDKNRVGLNLGEGAAYLVLQRKEDIQPENILGELKGFANANDAFHQTASSDVGEGATLAMQNALSLAKLLPNEIDYINAHGTGTQNNDQSETNALVRIFGDDANLKYSSTKAFTGHTLAAAGSIEAVIALLSIKNNFMPANIGLKNPIDTAVFKPLKESLNQTTNTVLSNSFGFGGNCSTLIFSE